jgi:hypothetical protein
MLSIGCNLDILDESAKGWNCNNLAAIECLNIKMHYARRQALVYNSWCKNMRVNLGCKNEKGRAVEAIHQLSKNMYTCIGDA